MFNYGMKDVKLFAICFLGIVLFLLFMIPIDNWWFLWDYLETTPLWIVIGQSSILFFAAFTLTMFIIIIRALIK
ncbi:MAG: hypothetical protein ACXACR_02485 [Candidatus Hodarchaeales archaeon]